MAKDYLTGIALLFVVVLLWTLSNFVTQALFINGYHKPFFVTYFNTSSFSLYLVPFFCRYASSRLKNSLGSHVKYAPLTAPLDQENIHVPDSSHEIESEPLSANTLEPLEHLPPLTVSETAQLAAIFCSFWFIANWTLNASLDYTKVASATILSSTSGFFTLGIGRIFRVESLSSTKVIALIMSFLGVVLVSLSDSNTKDGIVNMTTSDINDSPVAPNPLLGDVLALLAALFYALYVILLKVRIGSESRIDMQLFFGFVGAINIIALIPVGIILHFTGFEQFSWPSAGKECAAVLLNMFITLSSDYIYVLAMLRTTPLIVTIGLSLTIPLSIIGDEVLGIPTQTQAIFGALLVLTGFGLVGWNNRP